METLTLTNGNMRKYTVDLPKLHILDRHINDTALDHIAEDTGLHFKDTGWGYVAQPENSQQVVRLFLTYNFKTQYHDNATTKNTIYLKLGILEGFKVEHICFDCCKANHIHTGGLKQGDRLTV